MIAAPMIGVLAVWIISPTCLREGWYVFQGLIPNFEGQIFILWVEGGSEEKSGEEKLSSGSWLWRFRNCNASTCFRLWCVIYTRIRIFWAKFSQLVSLFFQNG
jgi:hypothetical protein